MPYHDIRRSSYDYSNSLPPRGLYPSPNLILEAWMQRN